ncbi:MAG: galactokinase family protein [Eubacteriales bacterium]|nr:galactokinase family protein [Eubacteriales bacterium]
MTQQTDKQALFHALYGRDAADAQARLDALKQTFFKTYGEGTVRFFSAPGRTEIGGNHTDHQRGRVLAAAVSVDTVAAVRPTGGMIVRLRSEGFPTEFCVDLSETQAREAEKNTTFALIRGTAARMAALGYAIGGFDACVTSSVLRGSGLSSSAAFEVLIAAIFHGLFNAGEMDAKQRAMIAQYAENVYFGKPSGLMDQMASSVGALVAIDFGDPAHPVVEKVDYDFEKNGYYLVVTDTGGSHDDLTPEYAAIPAEMTQVAQAMGADKLRGVDESVFYASIAQLRAQGISDRAILRAAHFLGDDPRSAAEAQALRQGDMETFFALILESGESSWQLLQNCYVPGSTAQNIPLALTLSRRVLAGKGAWRVHGGGFAGTIQAFVPADTLSSYIGTLESQFGKGACTVLSIRKYGAVEIPD